MTDITSPRLIAEAPGVGLYGAYPPSEPSPQAGGNGTARTDRSAFAFALVAHALLFAALTVSIARRRPPMRAAPEAMDVQLVDAVGLRSAAPAPATEAPREAQAPELGPPVETPPPPSAAPTPKPAEAKPEGATPAPKPSPKPAARLSSDFLKDLPAAKPATAGRLGADFLKGLPTASAGTGETARAALTGMQVNGLAAAIKRQVQPCYDLGALGGTPAMQITTVLQLRFEPDGSIAGTPRLVEQQGVTPANRAYARQMEDVSRRAVLRCAPLSLPKELYAGGWENITMGFIPGQMR